MVSNLLEINGVTFPPKPTFVPKNKFKSVFYDDTKLEPEDSYTSITSQGRSL